MEDELEFLRYFYDAAGDAFGPADADIYRMIADDYAKQSGKKAPAEYRRHEEEEE